MAAYTEHTLITRQTREAAREIRLLRSMVAQVAQFAEARVMELLWDIRRELTDEGLFRAFVSQETGLDADLALGMASAWDSARRNRALREFAQQKPGETVALIQQMVEAGFDAADESDAEVARVLSLPARKRREALRDIIECGHQAAAGHHPADREEIRTLTAERDAAIDRLHEATRFERDPATKLIRLTRELSDQVRDATARVMHVLEHEVEALNRPAQDNLMADCETLIACAETIMAKTLPGDDPAPDGDD